MNSTSAATRPPRRWHLRRNSRNYQHNLECRRVGRNISMAARSRRMDTTSAAMTAAVYLNGPGDQINTDPLLGPLQNNGGPTLTHALLPGSPAIDAGDPNFTPPPFYDQRGCPFFACSTVASMSVHSRRNRPAAVFGSKTAPNSATSPVGRPASSTLNSQSRTLWRVA